MQKITPHLWYDTETATAAVLYTSAFRTCGGSASDKKSSRIKDVTHMEDTPSGTVEIVSAELFGQEFVLMSAGPYFQFTPAVSFLVACPTPKQVDALWKRLAEGGQALMELGKYPLSERYGWVQDRYGPGEDPDREGTVKHAAFTLEGQAFAAMDSAGAHGFAFNEAISFFVNCDTQEEVDYYWGKLSAVPEAEQCGWLKDRYGLSWQIVPTVLTKMNRDKDKRKVARVTQAFLKMKKFDVAELERAYAAG
jgi:predicted 3-demethylubiquinone-9 3-methyltransferase (glyoxalase superfamily)